MNLNVDTNKLNEKTKLLNKYIKDYNDNSYNIFNEISKIDSYWKGVDADFFLEKINKEKSQNVLISEGIEKINNFYKEVEAIYNNFKK